MLHTACLFASLVLLMTAAKEKGKEKKPINYLDWR
jgi:hypothetical protein